MTTDRLLKTIREVEIPRSYRMRNADACAIREEAHGDAYEIMILAFRFGFIQGEKAARAEAKREKKRLMEQDATGWFSYLSRWLERNIGNERLLRLTGRFARAMEDDLMKKVKEDGSCWTGGEGHGG